MSTDFVLRVGEAAICACIAVTVGAGGGLALYGGYKLNQAFTMKRDLQTLKERGVKVET